MGLRQTTQTALSGAFWPVAALTAVSVLILLGGDSARLALRFDRSGLEALEVYRLVTGHLVHLGVGHFLLNAAGLLLVAFLVGSGLGVAGWCLTIAVSIAAIDVSFWIFNPELTWYVGLSGVLHGMLVAGALATHRERPVESAVVLALVAAKLLFEQFLGPLPGSEAGSGGDVVVDAHLYGAVGGLISVAILAGLRRRASV